MSSREPPTFADLLRLASEETVDSFSRALEVPVLITTASLIGRLKVGPAAKDTGLIELPGAQEEDPKRKHALLAKVFLVTKRLTEDPTRVSVGRTGENDLPLDDPSVSKRHAYIEIANGGYFVEDAGSRNGTYVNGSRLQPSSRQEIKDEDAVTFGRLAFQYFTPAVLYEALRFSTGK